MKKEKKRYMPMYRQFWENMDTTDRIELILVYATILLGFVAISIFIAFGIQTSN